MKPAPNFTKWPDPVSGEWKLELLQWLAKTQNLKVLIETGTCQGITPWRLQNDFKHISTIELHKGLFEESRMRLSGIPNVYQYFGSSKEKLASMIWDAYSIFDCARNKFLFWLDAHSSGPHTADDDDPLPFEIATIMRMCPDGLIVVDDMIGVDQFIGQISNQVKDLTGWKIEYRTGEILMYHEGEYNIPEFE